ncbi:MAG: Gfo/Idh/MocA family oxidoreductase [Proteobacteria bacterium]|nr:Gfo/Idh/MocA family oxidoreductase [Pseudomonadota bacterium]
MLSVLIIGCGNIAGGFDQGRPAGYRPYTHAGAFRRDGRFDLVASVDPDSAKRAEFMAEWSVPRGFDSVAELAEQGMHFDVVSICSPTPCHAGDLEVAMHLTPRLIFCEKPVTPSLAQTKKRVALCAEAKVLLAVNHNRRWDPEIVRLRADILAVKWGALRSATAIYNKGILNNGSHMLDLLHLLIGPMDVVRVGEPVADFFPADPTIPAWLVGPGGLPVHLACGHAADYAIFELQLVFSAGVLAMEDGGLFWRERRAVDSETFKGYRMLDAGIRRQGGDDHSMCRAVDNIYRAITLGEPLASTGESALAAQRLCERIKQMALAS